MSVQLFLALRVKSKPRIQTRSVHSPATASDGLRLLVTRFRGRGLPADRYDVWMANLGPSEQLLRAFQQGKVTWPRFRQRYRAELFQSDEVDARNPSIKNHGQKFTLRLLQRLAEEQTITVLCHCSEDQAHCHRHLLKQILDRPI
jgi:uncharacterized protein YeaO (DUF488 family)